MFEDQDDEIMIEDKMNDGDLGFARTETATLNPT